MPSGVLLCGGVLGCFACHDVRELLVDHGSSMRMSSRSMRAGAIVLAAVMMSSMVACSGPSASEKASASFHNSVSAARDALFEEAKATNQGFFDLQESLGLQGGAEELPAQMHRYVMGNAAKYVADLNAQLKESGERTEPDTHAEMVGPVLYEGEKKSGAEEADSRAEIVIERCVDARKSPRLDSRGEPIPGSTNLVHHILYMDHDSDGELKIFEAWSQEVTTCPVNA
ncbi:hypothetical protein [Propionibacterium freudenreichii]|nr:hypothetical protein [Propionibacterium freudenreichii]